ncbi:hypothetical protein UB45_04985 [Terrabacter sp. 28]|nr:hypothetical protein UB45_04985 [Terrabacter sp. 28]
MNGRLYVREPNDDAIETLKHLAQKIHNLAGKAKPCWERHIKRMKSDKDYQQAVHDLLAQLSERPGQAGRILRRVAAAHTIAIKLL